MGLQKRESTGGKAEFFKINIKEGCFQQGSGEHKVKFAPGDADLSGTVIGFVVDPNEYEGKKSEELRLILKDPEAGKPNMHVSVLINNDSTGVGSFGLRVLASLNAADITKPVTLFPWAIKKGEKLGDGVADNDMTGCTFYQGGEKIVPDFGDGVTKLPELPKVSVGAKQVIDKTAWEQMLDKLLDRLASRLTPAPAEGSRPDVDVDEAAGAAEAAAAGAQQQQFRSRATPA
jgi:hypothetical protein